MISVIIPIYNVEEYLRECLESCINQTLKDLEIICINDGSTDNSLNTILEYAKKDSRIKVIDKKNSGYGHSCNIGLKESNGEYIAILEPDDFIDSNMYSNLYQIAKKNDLDIAKCAYYDYFHTPKKKFSKAMWCDRLSLSKEIFDISECPELLFYHPSIWAGIYKKSFLLENNITFIQAPGAGWADNPFSIQTLCLAKKISFLKEPYYFYRLSNINSSSNLKDFNIPLDRIKDMQNFLSQAEIFSAKYLNFLFKRYFRYLLLSIFVAKKQKISNIEISSKTTPIINDILKNFRPSLKARSQFLALKYTPISVTYKAYILMRFIKHMLKTKNNGGGG